MILKVLTNSLVLNLQVNASLSQNLRITNPGQLENGRRMDGSARNDHLLLRVDSVLLAITDKSDASRLVAIKDNVGNSGAAENVQIRAMSVCREVSSRRVRAHTLIWTTSGDQAESVIESDMISRPRIFGLLRHVSGFVTGMDEVVFDGETPVIERSPGWARSTMVFTDELCQQSA